MMQGLFSRHARVLSALIAGLGIFALSGASARASVVATDACDNSTLSQPFVPWGDSSYYKLVPGSSFESGATGWTLSGKAGVVAGSETFGATGSVGSQSLSLPAGSSAQSPYTCVDAAYPSFRFFARNNGVASTVLVSVVYKTVLGLQVALPVGTVLLTPSWAPSAVMLTVSAIPAALSGGTTNIALRFTAATGSSQIDDVFVDPRLSP